MQYKTYSRHIVYTLVLFGLLVLSGKSCFERFQDKFWPPKDNLDSSAGKAHLSEYTPAKNKDSNTSSDPVQKVLDVDAGAKCDKGQRGGSGGYAPPPPSSPSVEVDRELPLDDSIKVLQATDTDLCSSFVVVYEEFIHINPNKKSAPEMPNPMPQELDQKKSGQGLGKEVSNVDREVNTETKQIPVQPVAQNDSEEVVTVAEQEDDEGGTLGLVEDSLDPLTNDAEEQEDNKDNKEGVLEKEILEPLEENGLEEEDDEEEVETLAQQDYNGGGACDSCLDKSDPV